MSEDVLDGVKKGRLKLLKLGGGGRRRRCIVDCIFMPSIDSGMESEHQLETVGIDIFV